EGTVVEDGLGCTITSVDRATEVPELPAVDPDAEPVAEVVSEDLEEPEEGACDGAVMRFLTVDMVGVKASDGTTFFNSFGEERPVNLRVGQGQLIAGLETSLGDMKVGGRRQITVPADQAYGAEGNAAQGIGPDETLIFVVDVFAATDQPETCNAPLPIQAGVREGKPTTVDL